MNNKKLNRRNFITYTSLSSITAISWPFFAGCQNSNNNSNNLVNVASSTKSDNFNPDVDIALTAVERQQNILPGNATTVWAFESRLISGNKENLQQIENSYLGPIIRVQKGQNIRIRFKNELSENSIVHWHGMHVPEEDDGHPKDVISPGNEYIYEYEIKNRAGTYWFHPHPHGRTGPQVYNGLAGMLIVTDEEEQKLDLPTGEFDIPVIIQDRTFDNNHQLVYLNRRMMDRMMGFLGNQILINGKSDQMIKVKSGCVYRFRLLNASNSRFYKLAWEDGTPLTVIGKDGSLLDRPKTMPYVMLGVGERIDLWVDFQNQPVGKQLLMKSMPFSTGMMMGGMMGGMMGSNLPLGGEYPVLKIEVNQQGSNNYQLPDKLAKYEPIALATAINAGTPRNFKFFMQRMEWTINGRTWETTGVTKEETVKLNTTEVWELENSSMMGNRGMMGKDKENGGMMGNRGMMGKDKENGGMMGGGMQMPHPIHIHHVQFNVLERNTENMNPDVWDSVKDGFISGGWQDTVLLMPGMKIKVIMTFKNFTGLFLYHCHNLEHEDMGMMRNFKIV